MALELVPLCSVDIVLGSRFAIGKGPSGDRAVAEVLEATVTGDRVRATLVGRAAADWVTVSGSVGTLDVRLTLQTDDGAYILVQYVGRLDRSRPLGEAAIYVAPRFETGDERYAWLNLVQAAGKGTLNGKQLHYEWYELR